MNADLRSAALGAAPFASAPVTLSGWADAMRARVVRALDGALPASDEHPARLHAAMRYAVLGGGKRVRALLAYASGELAGADVEIVDDAAAAVELIHAYSLVHDDLPCMDDDDLRRGKPTVHMAFDEATALLVGDALQSLAFGLLCKRGGKAGAACCALDGIALLAAATGSRGMAGGQAIDLESVGAALAWPELEAMHRAKTGALLRASVLLGVIAGQALAEREKDALETYAKAIGLAFQIVDDILDVETETAILGKTAGKDAANNKPTTVTLLGLLGARQRAEALRIEAQAALDVFDRKADRLRELADFVVLRKY